MENIDGMSVGARRGAVEMTGIKTGRQKRSTEIQMITETGREGRRAMRKRKEEVVVIERKMEETIASGKKEAIRTKREGRGRVTRIERGTMEMIGTRREEREGRIDRKMRMTRAAETGIGRRETKMGRGTKRRMGGVKTITEERR